MRNLKEYDEWLKSYYKRLKVSKITPFKFSVTDRQEFKRCIRRWNYSSYNGMSIEPKAPNVKLLFGTEIHSALEYFYKNTFSCVEFFKQRWNNYVAYQKKRMLDLDLTELEAHLPLGIAILKGYEEYANDDKWSILATEFEIEYPLVDNDGEPILIRRNGNASNYGVYNPIVCGRIDLVIYDDSTKQYYVVDHKTGTNHLNPKDLEWDDQLTIYSAICSKIFETKFNAMYNFMRKKIPTVPKILKNGSLSKAANQDTTYEIYMQEIINNNLRVQDYQDILSTFQTKQTGFYERITLPKSELWNNCLENQLKQEALMMIVALENQVNISTCTSSCSWDCNYHMLCRTQSIGGNIKPLIEQYYQERRT